MLLSLAVLGLAAAALISINRADDARDPVRSVAASLTCADCNGLSIEDSPSLMASAMRAEVRRQVAAGRDAADIRGWFVRRYGPGVDLVPDHRGWGLILWTGPVLIAAVLLGSVVRRSARSRKGGDRRAASSMHRPTLRALPVSPQPRRVAPVLVLVATGLAAALITVPTLSVQQQRARSGPIEASAARTDGIASLFRAAEARPTSPGAWLELAQALEDADRYGEAAAAYERLAALEPHADGVGLRVGLNLVRAGHPSAALRWLRPVARRHPHNADVRALLDAAVAGREGDVPASTTERDANQAIQGDR